MGEHGTGARWALSSVGRAMVAVCVSGLLAADLAHGAPHQTELVSRAGGPDGATADRLSHQNAASADGRYVAFTSVGTNLVPEATDARPQIYVRDLVEDETVLVSRADGPDGEPADFGATSPSISADGRYVAFESVATNLGPADGTMNIYVRDLEAGSTVLVSKPGGPGTEPANDHSHMASISGSGRQVAFLSLATNLAPEDTDGRTDVYLHDVEDDSTVLVSRASGADGAKADADSMATPSLSRDGSRVAFASVASNLSPQSPDGGVFVRDVESATTVLVSRAAGADGEDANDASSHPSISGDGRKVAFSSRATNLSVDDEEETWDVFVRDLDTNALTLVTRASGPDGEASIGGGAFPAISQDGRFVAFWAATWDLVPDARGFGVYRRDLLHDQTELAARENGIDGRPVPAYQQLSISADGRMISFNTSDRALTGMAGYVRDTQVFRRDLGPADGAVEFPRTAIELGPPDGEAVAERRPEFGFTASVEPVVFRCRLALAAQESPPWAPCSGPGASHRPETPLPDGEYRFEVAAVDYSSNWDPDPAVRRFTVDATAPPAPALRRFAPAAPANHNTPRLRGTAEDGAEIAIYGGDGCEGEPVSRGSAAELAGAGVELLVPDDSEVTFRAVAADRAGNVSGCSAGLAYTEDSTAPDTTVEAGAGGSERVPTFEFAASEAGSSFECRLDEQEFAPCSGPGASHASQQELPNGRHVFAVRAVDAAANVDPTPATLAFTVDVAENPDPPGPIEDGATTGPDAPPAGEDGRNPPGRAPVGPDGHRADTDGPALRVRTRPWRNLGRPVRLHARCGELCTVRARGWLRLGRAAPRGGRRPASRARWRPLGAVVGRESVARGRVRLKLRLPRKVAKRARRGKSRRPPLAMKVVVAAWDEAGNRSERHRAMVRLRRQRR